jgi:hypothetical protein
MIRKGGHRFSEKIMLKQKALSQREKAPEDAPGLLLSS